MDKISRTSRMEAIKRRRKIGQAKQWRNGIAEPRSGRSDGEGERVAHSLSRHLIIRATGCYVSDFGSPIKPRR